MNTEELFTYVDHTALQAYTSWEQIEALCREAETYRMASVCIPGCYVKRAHEAFPGLNICTVIGFPLGYSVREAKIAEAKQAAEDGASEIDMVVNLCDVKNREYEKVKNEIAAVKQAAGERVLKVILVANGLIWAPSFT